MKSKPKKVAPNNKVLSGVNEFRMEQIELLTFVSAIAKRYAGINVPNNEVIATYFHLCKGISAKLLNPITNKNIAQKIILNEPNSNGDNPTSPFLIKINELPHIKANKASKIHFICSDFITKNYLANFVIILRMTILKISYFCGAFQLDNKH